MIQNELCFNSLYTIHLHLLEYVFKIGERKKIMAHFPFACDQNLSKICSLDSRSHFYYQAKR